MGNEVDGISDKAVCIVVGIVSTEYCSVTNGPVGLEVESFDKVGVDTKLCGRGVLVIAVK